MHSLGSRGCGRIYARRLPPTRACVSGYDRSGTAACRPEPLGSPWAAVVCLPLCEERLLLAKPVDPRSPGEPRINATIGGVVIGCVALAAVDAIGGVVVGCVATAAALDDIGGVGLTADAVAPLGGVLVDRRLEVLVGPSCSWTSHTT